MSVDVIRETPLMVAEFGGTARSGKGTIVAALAERNGWATEETGGDYRTVAYTILEEGLVTAEMTEKVIQKRVDDIDGDHISQIVASRPQIEAELGKDVLYTPEVNKVVPIVGEMPHVRKAVKSGFAQRVAAVVADPSVEVLLVDGRNLGPVVEMVPNTNLFLRTFTSCSDQEATMRELARNSQLNENGGPINYQVYQETLDNITKRNARDRNRDMDPVVPDVGSLSYWFDGEGSFNPYTDAIHRGMGVTAVDLGLQVHFETGHYRTLDIDDPVASMVTAAEIMVHEALAALDPATKQADNDHYLESLHLAAS